MNIEQTKEAIRIMQAFVDGKEVEVQRLLAGSCWIPACAPCWDWLNGNYRIKPTAKLRPWTADEVPLGAWVRMKNMNNTRSMIVSASALNLEMLFQTYEHSTDGGVTWKPCGVVEESK